MSRAALFVLLVNAAAVALAAPVPKDDDAARLARIYGTPYEFKNPDHLALDGEKLRVFVGLPADSVSPAPQRLAFAGVRGPRGNESPIGDPRVWRDVKGNFTVSAKVSFAACSESAPRDIVRMAGLLASVESNNFLALSRNGTRDIGLRYVHPNGVRTGGISMGSATDALYLRLRREGAMITSGYSSDGKTWEELFPDVVAWDETVKVGLFVKSFVGAPYETAFDEYKLSMPKK
jgi:regulation of enolase protein 1 (concanavalin A-like superfamily)